MIVMKFGGSSLADADRIRYMSEIVKARLDRKPVLVLSALGDTTDHLLEAGDAALKRGVVSLEKIETLHSKTIEELELDDSVLKDVRALITEMQILLMGISLIREMTGRTRDYLLSFGERLSVRILAAHFMKQGINAEALDAWDAGFITNSTFMSAELIEESWELIPSKLLPLVDENILPIVTGFIAKDERGNITTMGRGGSDLTATMIGASCRAEEIQVWKDVDGILTADPRVVENARPVKTITYEAASELAYYGAQVLHPRTMQPCIKTGTPVLVKNSYNPDALGTRITLHPEGEISPIQAISFRKNITVMDIVSSHMLGQYGFLDEVFTLFAKHCVSVDMMATSEVSVSLSVDSVHDLNALIKDLSRIASVEIHSGKAIVTIIGDVQHASAILARAFKICELLNVHVEMVSQGASKVNISFVVDDRDAAEVVKGLHNDFFGANS